MPVIDLETKGNRVTRGGRISALLAFAAAASFAQLPTARKQQFDEAERRIVRLSPASVPGLPGNIVRELQRRGCTIPQTAYAKKAENAIRGEFARPGQADWAVLCSVQGLSSILVFWSGSEKSPAEIAPMEDRIFLQGVTAGQIGYSRALGAAGRDFIMRHYDAYGGPKPPPIEHQGIDDAFVGKASVTWYFHGGKWLKLTGAD